MRILLQLTLLLLYISYSFQSKSQTNVLVNGMKANTGIEVNESSVTDLGRNKVLVDTGNRNLLKNASFEGAVDVTARPIEWSCEGSLAFTKEEVPSPDGRHMASMTCFSGICECSQEVETKHNLEGFASVYALENSLLPGAWFFVKIDDGDEFKQELEGALKKYTQPLFDLGAAKAKVGIRIDASTEAKRVFFDDAQLSYGYSFGSVKYNGATKDVPCSGSWTTNTTYKCRYVRDGEYAIISYLVTASGVPSPDTELDLNFPPEVGEVDLSKIDNTQAIALDGTLVKRSLNRHSLVAIFDTSVPSKFSVRAASNSSQVTRSFPIAWGSGDDLNITVRVPIKGFRSSFDVLTSAANPYDLKSHLSFSFSIATDGSTANDYFSIVSSSSKEATGKYSVSFKPSTFSVPPSCSPAVVSGDNAVDVTAKLKAPITKDGITYNTTGNGAFIDTYTIWKCTKTGQDLIEALQGQVSAALHEKNIVYEDEFHTDERKTNRIWDGKPIYKKCFKGNANNGRTIASSVHNVIRVGGTSDWASGFSSTIPLHISVSSRYIFEISNTTRDLYEVVSGTPQGRPVVYCIEYTKL